LTDKNYTENIQKNSNLINQIKDSEATLAKIAKEKFNEKQEFDQQK